MVYVVDSAGLTGSKPLSLTVEGLTITTPSPLPNGTACMVYSLTFEATGGTLPYGWAISAGTLPSGMSLNQTTGVLSGTPSTSGTFNFTVQVTDSATYPYNPATGSKAFSLTINPSDLVIVTSSPLPDGRVNTAYYQALAATGGTKPYSWTGTSGTLPAGMSLNQATGVLSGTPTQSGQFSFTVEVRSAAGGCAASKAFSLFIEGVGPPQIITTSPLPSGSTCQTYSQTLTASGGTPPYRWAITGGSLPTGLSLDAASGAVTGTPGATGVFNFTVQVTDSATPAATDSRAFALTIAAGDLTVTTSTLPNGKVNTPYSTTLTAAGGTTPYTWSVPPETLPAGLTLSSAGVLSGTPTVAGTSTFTVEVRSAAGGCTGRKALSLTIDPAAVLTIATTSPLPGATVGVAYGQTLSATGGVTPYTWSATGLPAWLSLDTATGLLSGIPASAGVADFSIRVTDRAQNTATKAFSLTVNPSVTALTIITASPLPQAWLGVAYSVSLVATGGTAPYGWSATGSLPGGLALSTTGVLSGVPTAAGTFSFTAQVTDANRRTATKACTLVVSTIPAATLAGLPDIPPPQEQPKVALTLAAAYPAAITGWITLSFAPNVVTPAASYPAVQFATGGQTVDFRIPANQTRATFSAAGAAISELAVQVGNVAGTITLTARLWVGDQDVTPTEAPSRVIQIDRLPPSITADSVRVVRTGKGFEVQLTGFSTPRQVKEAEFQFTPASNADLRTLKLTVNVEKAFSDWYRDAASAAFGSAFQYTQPFTIEGDVNAVTAVSVTLKNDKGSSQAVTRNF